MAEPNDPPPLELWQYYEAEYNEPHETPELTAADRISIAAIAGVVVGIILSVLYDHFTGGPGFGVIFQ